MTVGAEAAAIDPAGQIDRHAAVKFDDISPCLSFDGQPRYAISIEQKDCWVVTITITDSANPLTSEMHIREFGSLIKALDFLARAVRNSEVHSIADRRGKPATARPCNASVTPLDELRG
jgi:hypothetical protein